LFELIKTLAIGTGFNFKSFQRLSAQIRMNTIDVRIYTGKFNSSGFESDVIGFLKRFKRLINMLDWLMSETSQDTPPVDALLGWGASSGIAAFLGFVTALLQ